MTWDVLAEALLWVHEVAPTFPRARMHGGDPSKTEPYGYTGWKGNQGYVSILNPAKKEQSYEFTLDRNFGVPAEMKAGTVYHLSSPLVESTASLEKTYKVEDTIKLTLKPETTYILNFQQEKAQDWSALKKLQEAASQHFGK